VRAAFVATFVALYLLAAAAGNAVPVRSGVGCTSSQPSTPRLRALAATPRSVVTVVDVYVHVLRTARHGAVSRPRIHSQLRALDAAFAGRESRYAARSPFRFRLADVDVSRNAAWYRMDEGSLAEEHAKRALHRGDGSDLNLYIGSNSAAVLGWGTQPTEYATSPRLDGVVIARHTMPGGRHGRYSAGDGAVHETGHWLGLFHTFTGGCSKPGDRVADTPAEARPSYGCSRSRDTCTAPGNDPVHNFMDYGDDACMNSFTAGQVDRMVRLWSRLRANVTSP
jgi:Pregnancy-associated plasma protein-A